MDNIEENVLEELFFYLLDEGHTLAEIEEAMSEPEFEVLLEEYVTEAESLNEISTDMLKRSAKRAFSKGSDYRHNELEIGGKPWKYDSGAGMEMNKKTHRKYRQSDKFRKALKDRGVKVDKYGVEESFNNDALVASADRAEKGRWWGKYKANTKGKPPANAFRVKKNQMIQQHLKDLKDKGKPEVSADRLKKTDMIQQYLKDKDKKPVAEQHAFIGKVHLDPAEKLNNREYGPSKFLKNKSSEPKDSDKSEYKPHGHGAAVAPDVDEGSRNTRMLKGDYPWGKVGATMTKAALSLVKAMHKPADKAAAMNKIWKSQENFHNFVSGKLDLSEPKVSKITLSKVKGIH